MDLFEEHFHCSFRPPLPLGTTLDNPASIISDDYNYYMCFMYLVCLLVSLACQGVDFVS